MQSSAGAETTQRFSSISNDRLLEGWPQAGSHCKHSHKEKGQRAKTPLTCGVSDGTRTRDIQDHNLTLYQLNYTHHGRQTRSGDVDTSCSGSRGPN